MPTWSTEQLAGAVPSHITNALLTAESSSDALKNLYLILKQTDDKNSIPHLCRKAGIPSTGYFSDVMKGKRRLHIKYRDGIIRAFALRGVAAKYLRLLIAVDNEKNKAKADIIREKLPALRKMLAVVRRDIGEDAKSFFFALEVFCAFGLFRNEPRRADLAHYFSDHRASEIEKAITMLEKMGLVRAENDRLLLVSSQVDFIGEKIPQIEYLKLAFAHGVQSLSQWFEQPNLALFSSTNISVNKKAYEDKLVKVRDAVEVVRSELETEDANMLVRLNFQIYPIH